jgi:hypothetical protein
VVSQEKIFLEIDQSETNEATNTYHFSHRRTSGFGFFTTPRPILRASEHRLILKTVFMKKYDATVALIGRKL